MRSHLHHPVTLKVGQIRVFNIFSNQNISEVGSSSSSKRLSPGEKLRDALICFEKSLDMLLTDLIKEVTNTEERTSSVICNLKVSNSL